MLFHNNIYFNFAFSFNEYTKMELKVLKQEIDRIISSEDSNEDTLQKICDYLERTVSYYDWLVFILKMELKTN